MPRVSVKENKNIYQLSREELGLTREKASELLEYISPERIERIENEKCIPHSDEVLMFADKYRKPEICNYFCSKQCDVGNRYVPEIKMKDLSQIVLELVTSVNSVQNAQMKLVEISADGKIEKEEIDDFVRIQNELEEISVAVETLQLWTEKMLADGVIDIDEYNKKRAEE